jgi:hypothetical protein
MGKRLLRVIVLTLLVTPNVPAAPEGVQARRKLLSLGVDEIVFACRSQVADQHWYANFGYYFDGPRHGCFGDAGSLKVLSVKTGTVSTLLEDSQGSIRDPQVHYDGQTILFSWRRGGEAQYHLYEINRDGSGLRQLTRGIYDDLEPSYLPDGGIVFVSARCKRWVNCWQTQVAALYRCDAKGENIRILSANIEQDNTPWVLPDGRVLFTRWEYVDRSQVNFHHLWACHPDGSNPVAYFGNMHPGNVFIDAKPIPGTGELVFISSPGHGRREHAGVVAVVSGRHGPDSQSSYRQISWVSGASYRDPYPINEDCFLVARGRDLLVMDAAGNERRLLTADVTLHEPRPLRARPREPVMPSQIAADKATGSAILADIHRGRNMKGVKRGDVKRLLIVETLPKPLNFGQRLWDFVPISHGGTFTLERILGSVPVEADGSAHFELPANRPVFFIALDENNTAVKRMHSFMSVMPGETVSCVGCHEGRALTPGNSASATLVALKRPASKIVPLAGVPYMHDYPRDIQPILDRHCVRCHNPDQPRVRVLLTGDRGGIFSMSYFTLISRRLVSDARNGMGNTAPRAVGDSASPLMNMLNGQHYEVKLSAEEIRMIRSWIHVGGPYAGTYAALGTGMIHRELALAPSYERIRTSAKTAFDQCCSKCHQGQFPELRNHSISSGGHESLLDPHFAFNLTRPRKSPLLLAPLARNAAGWSLCQQSSGDKATGRTTAIFMDTDDPDYQALLAYVEFGQAALEQNKRWDMSGFKPSPHYVREMKRYGILPESFDLAHDSIDVHAVDRRYWESSWYYPQGAPELHPNKRLQQLLTASDPDHAWETDITSSKVKPSPPIEP